MRLLVPLRKPAFRRLAAGRLCSQLGEWLLLAALVGWVYQRSHSTGAVALLLLVRLAPPILGGGVAAAVVDRFRRERLLVTLEAGRAASATMALLGVATSSQLLVFAGACAAGLLAALSDVAVRASVPALVAEVELPAANAVLGVSQEAALAGGALAGGLVLGLAGPQPAVAAAAVCSGAATIVYSRIAGAGGPGISARRKTGLRDGVRHLLSRRTVLVVIVAFATATVATGLANATLPRFLGEELGLGPSGYGFGLAALAFGLALGEAAAGLLAVERVLPRSIGFSLLAMGLLFAALAVAPNAWVALTLLALVGIADGTSEVVFDTVVQRECDPAYLGAVFGLGAALVRTSLVGAVAVAPLLNAVAAPGVVIFVGSACLLVASAAALVGSGAWANAPLAEPA